MKKQNVQSVIKNNNIKYDNKYFKELLNVNLILDNIKEFIVFKNIKGSLIIFSRFENQKSVNYVKINLKNHIFVNQQENIL